MPGIIKIDLEKVYGGWRAYLLNNSKAKHFGMLFDPSKQSKFPYANLKLIDRPTGGADLENNEASINVVFETEAYINNEEIMTLYNIDEASAQFFTELGFKRISGGNSPVKVSATVTKITSRFSYRNFCGYFLYDL